MSDTLHLISTGRAGDWNVAVIAIALVLYHLLIEFCFTL